jgi:hypothetical protein
MPRPRLKPAIVIASAVLSFGLLCLWSYTALIDNLRVSVWSAGHLTVNVQRGRMEWRRVYALKNEIPAASYTQAPIPPQRIVPNPPVTVLGFWYSSGHEMAFSMPDDDKVRLVDYWLLVIPLWFVLAIVSVPWALWLYRWYRRTRAHRVGFDLTVPQARA